jgi:hypothetical protein
MLFKLKYYIDFILSGLCGVKGWPRHVLISMLGMYKLVRSV